MNLNKPVHISVHTIVHSGTQCSMNSSEFLLSSRQLSSSSDAALF